MVLLMLGCNLGGCYTVPLCSACGVHMVRGAPQDECMLGLPIRKRQKPVKTTPSTLNPKESTAPGNSSNPKQNVPCGTSDRRDVEALNRNSQAANSTSRELHNTSQSDAKHAN